MTRLQKFLSDVVHKSIERTWSALIEPCALAVACGAGAAYAAGVNAMGEAASMATAKGTAKRCKFMVSLP